MSTIICGIASSAAIDSSGEQIDIEGMDISSLEGAVCNFEHKSEKTSDYIGKIVVAKKIFKPEDCSNEIELKYWNKCKIPFLFCMVTLFDDFQPSAKEVAAIFEFDQKNPHLKPTLGFSIEGSKQSKSGHVIDYSIARKLTVTAQPCNKTCEANKLDLSVPQSSDPLDFIFKSTEIELFNEETLQKSMSMTPPASKAPVAPKVGLKQAPPKVPKAGLKQPSTDKGSVIGQTNAGHKVFSKEKVHNYIHFNAEDHRNAAIIHGNSATAANAAKDYKSADHHNQKVKLHNQAAAGIERKANRFGNAVKAHTQKEEAKKIMGKSEEIDKALTAGGAGMSSPGNAIDGAALAKEELKKNKKKNWLARAEHEYNTWGKKEEFRSFMKKRMPHLTKCEIDAFGKTMILKKSVEAEKSFAQSMGLNKSEESHSPKYGEIKPHASHEEMMKLPSQAHHKLESAHEMHAFDAEDKGDHGLAAKHREIASMHMNYAAHKGSITPQNGVKFSTGEKKRSSELKAKRGVYAKQLHDKLSKALSAT